MKVKQVMKKHHLSMLFTLEPVDAEKIKDDEKHAKHKAQPIAHSASKMKADRLFRNDMDDEARQVVNEIHSEKPRLRS